MNQLKDEFFEFIRSFDFNPQKDDSNETEMNAPPLEMIEIESVQFKLKPLSKFNELLMPNVFKKHAMDYLELTNTIKPFKISYLKPAKYCIENSYKFNVTTITKSLNIMKYEVPNVQRINVLAQLELYNLKSIELVKITSNYRNNCLDTIGLPEPKIERRPFWIDLYELELVPITPVYVKELSHIISLPSNLTELLFIPMQKSLERLRMVNISNFEIFVDNTMNEVEPDQCATFQKKCIVNLDVLQNEALIEVLQNQKWEIYERPNILKGLQMIQVSRDNVIVIVKLSDIAKSISVLSTCRVKLIIEISEARELLNFSNEFLKLRDYVEDVYFTKCLEDTFACLEKLSGPFDFRAAETMYERALCHFYDGNSIVAQEKADDCGLKAFDLEGGTPQHQRNGPNSVTFSSSQATNSKFISSKALLLRLFQSELFTAVQALHYLQKYSNEPGIQYYLCERLKELPEEDIEVIIPQLCHLLIMNSNESAPIESFLCDRVKNSVHASIQILWILENYLHDLKIENRSPLTYIKTARILVEIQRISFKHEISESVWQNTRKQLLRASDHLDKFYGSSSKSNLRSSMSPFLCTGPPIIAFGAMLSALGCPHMVKAMQPLISMQTKKSDPFDRFHNHVSNKMRVSPILQGSTNAIAINPAPVSSPCPSTKSEAFSLASGTVGHSESSGPSLEELSKGKAFSLKRYIAKTAKTAKTLLSTSTNTSKSPPLPLMSNEMIEGIPSAPPATLFPSIPFYYHPEMQFVSSLVAVSERLVTLNRGSRLKALHAELCLINHNLPAPICVHSWCKESEGHHRILSILPYESSILNSAERVPFIIFIEVIRGCSDGEFNTLIQENRTKNSKECELHESEDNKSTVSGGSPDPMNCDNERGEALSPKSSSATNNNNTMIATASGLVDISERMRTAAVMLAQLARQSQVPGADLQSINTIRSRIIHEMETLEKDRLIDALQTRKGSTDFFDDQIVRVEGPQKPILDKQDPSAAVFQEDWGVRKERIARTSSFSHLVGWDVFSVIVKSSTDMRQELFAFQLVQEYQKIFKYANLPIFLRPCKILVASNGGGLIETVPNAISVHSIKKSILMSLGRTEFSPEDLSLKGYFIRKFGTPDSEAYGRAVDNFIKSLAGYSLLTYTLQVRDRHNGNILLDRDGNLIHIDFGFMLSNSPGYVGFESAPFKLTADYLDLLEGIGSEKWNRFKGLLTQGLLALRKHSDQLISLLEVLLPNSTLPCFYAGEPALLNFKERLHLSLTNQQIDLLIDRLMTTSALNVFTRLYDNYQYYTNGIL